MRTISQIIVLLFLLVSASAYGQSCPTPNYPSPSPSPIDSTSCGAAGSGGAETAQNTAKNNFCAQAPAKPITIAQMANLQQQVQQNKTIPFGNTEKHPLTSKPGPAVNRAPLVTLGEGSEVVLTGFVNSAHQEEAESVNCGTTVPDQPAYHDIHVSIVARPASAECSGVVVELIPHHRPVTWTADLVNEVSAAKLPVRITGQLMFDSSHTPCINNVPVTATGASDPARVSLWEVHPVYKFEVCTQSDCSSGTGWVALETWKKP